MNCDGVRGLLSAYVDGELSAGELLRVEQHLRRCHWCADEVDALRQAIALVASLQEVEVPAAFHIGLHQRLVALGPPLKTAGVASAHRVKRQDFRRWAVPAAAAAALVIGVTGLKSLTPPANPGAPVSYQVPGSPTTGADPVKNPGGNEVANKPDTPAPDPVGTDPGHNSTQPPVGGSNQPDGISAPPDTVTPPVVDEPGPKPAIGPTAPNSPVYTVASFLDNVSEPSSLPSRKQMIASLEASVAEPSTLAASLKAHFGPSAVNESKDPSSGIIRLQITVGATVFDAELASIESQTGAEANIFAIEKADQIQRTYDRIADLERQRERTANSLKGLTEPKAIEQAHGLLDELKQQADEATAAYQTLLDQVANGTIEVTLKPTNAR